MAPAVLPSLQAVLCTSYLGSFHTCPDVIVRVEVSGSMHGNRWRIFGFVPETGNDPRESVWEVHSVSAVRAKFSRREEYTLQ